MGAHNARFALAGWLEQTNGALPLNSRCVGKLAKDGCA
nr:MAG TPA: hypothetical protein [Caudoviricetes sp.]